MIDGHLRLALLVLFWVASGYIAYGQTQTRPYAQVIEDELLLRHPELASVTILVRDPETQQSRTLESASKETSRKADCIDSTPFRDTPGEEIGMLRIAFAAPNCADRSGEIAAELREVIPSVQALFDPFIVSASSTDVLAQRLTIETLQRNPDLLVLAFHVTAPGETVNKVVGINQPKFLGRASDDVDHEVARTGKMIVQVIPATHRMETHMPLRAADGSRVGTIVTVYLWHKESEAPGRVARSMQIRDELQPRIPNLASLLKP